MFVTVKFMRVMQSKVFKKFSNRKGIKLLKSISSETSLVLEKKWIQDLKKNAVATRAAK